MLFDQRGCGRSQRLASATNADLSTNTTAHLIEDIERLREHLGINRWVVACGSWGVTLGLVYAQRHPERVIAMVLGAVTAGTRRETDWITRDMGRVFPREWEQFTGTVPAAERATFLRLRRGCWLTPSRKCAHRRRGSGAPGRTRTCRWRRGGHPPSATGTRSSS